MRRNGCGRPPLGLGRVSSFYEGLQQALEERLGCLVLESNQVLLWSALVETGASVDLHGCGSLLATLSPTAPTGGADR